MGISTYISLKKYNFEISYSTIWKILKRTILIFLIGMAIGWFSQFCYYWGSAPDNLGSSEKLWNAIWTFDHIRILGVMQRLGICYGVTAIIVLIINHRYIPYLIAILLAGYFILLFCGNGFAYNETNILFIADRAILTPAHMYNPNVLDPEGVLSTIPAIAHVLLGFCVGRLMLESKKINKDRTDMLNSHLIKLFLIGTTLTFAGLLLSYGCPINKKIWSPTFVLTTCGLASSFLALLIWIIDVKGYKKWSIFFEAFGINPLFMYVLGSILAILFGSISFPWEGGNISIHGFLYKLILMPIFGETSGSLVYALLFVGINWCIGYQLYKRKIYIKL